MAYRYSLNGASVRSETASVRSAARAQRSTIKADYDPSGQIMLTDPDPSLSNNSARPTSYNVSYGLTFNTFFQGIIPHDESSCLTYYRDIHDFDSVGGSAIDLSATFPWSNYQLVGLESKELKVFKEAMSRINVRTLMTDITTDYLTDGASISSPLYSKEVGNYVDLIMHDVASCRIGRRPSYAVDPAISVNGQTALAEFFATSPFAEHIYKYSGKLVDVFRSGKSFTLDPATTIFVPRTSNRNHPTVSYLRRMLPIYMLEKLLYRATLIETSKRMRSTTHIQMGNDTWIPSVPEMNNILQEFMASELDPMGGWVVTRDGVNVGEVRSHSDAWKWTDAADQLVPHKLRALGISEAFLSSDVTYSNGEVALSVFMENLNSMREYITNRVFTNKLFPLIALKYGMVRDKNKLTDMTSLAGLLTNLGDYSNLRIPTLHWNKNLKTADDQVVNMLGTAAEKGLPIPLQMWAAAANLDLGVMLGGLETDNEIYEKIKKITGKDPRDQQADPKTGEDSDGGGGGGEWGSKRPERPSVSYLDTRRKESQTRKPILSRKFEGMFGDDDYGYTKTGKITKISNGQKQLRQNNLVKAAKALQDPNYRQHVTSVIRSKGLLPRNQFTGS